MQLAGRAGRGSVNARAADLARQPASEGERVMSSASARECRIWEGFYRQRGGGPDEAIAAHQADFAANVTPESSIWQLHPIRHR